MNNLTFIDICSIGHEPSAMGAELLECHSTLERADLTLGTPASPSITAALRLGDGVPVARTDLTHVLQHFSEAIPFPVIKALVLLRVGCEAVITLTGVAPRSVETSPVLTDPGLGLTLVLIYTAFSIRSALVPRSTDAHVGANEVLAFHLFLSTVVFSFLTLILVLAHSPVFSQNISSRALAFVGPVSVHTSEGTEQRVLGTFIYIFTCHHRTRFKSFLTGTFETSDHILAGSISTRIAHRTFISIHTFIPF